MVDGNYFNIWTWISGDISRSFWTGWSGMVNTLLTEAKPCSRCGGKMVADHQDKYCIMCGFRNCSDSEDIRHYEAEQQNIKRFVFRHKV